jgi:hypothetical protein
MPQITLSLAQCQQLVQFCKTNGQAEYFIAKDHGAYLGASVGDKPEQQCLFYFAGCNPAKDEDWYDNAHYKFGGDDFGELLPVAALEKSLATAAKWMADMQAQGRKYKPVRGVCWNITARRLIVKLVS